MRQLTLSDLSFWETSGINMEKLVFEKGFGRSKVTIKGIGYSVHTNIYSII